MVEHRIDLNPTRSPLDKKRYRHVTLRNGLEAVLVEDTIAMRGGVRTGRGRTTCDDDEEDCGESGLRDAACAVLVGGGSASDPIECPGLAHFLEHLLFMGSSKYPVENEYESYVSKHGGSDNAYTDWEYTVFQLEIPLPFLSGALDRLAQFFLHPLLSESAVERELNSIESEFLLNKDDDSIRLQQLLSQSFRSNHPMHKFSWGNTYSLSFMPKQHGVDPMLALRDFFETHYYAQNMKIVIQGAQSLDRLEEYVEQCFGDIPSLPRNGAEPNLQYKQLIEAGLPWALDEAPMVYRVITVTERHTVQISWQLPSQVYEYHTKRTEILSHLLGHEASGSILSHLKRTYNAVGCSAGLDDENNATSHAIFAITISLNSMDQWADVVRSVYAYLNMLRDEGMPSYVYEEVRDIAKLSYEYGDERDPGETVEDIVEDMFRIRDKDRILDGPSLYSEFDWPGICRLLEIMTPQKGKIHLLSSSFEPAGQVNVHREEWFETQYWTEVVSESLLQDWTGVRLGDKLTPPPRNPFVPTNFQVKAKSHKLVTRQIKICLTIGKKQEWLPCTVIDFNDSRQAILVCYEDGEEKWHTLDDVEATVSGTLDNRAFKFRLGANENDTSAFPPIPPASKHVPQQIHCSSSLRLWWLQDSKYQRPITALRLQIVCQKANKDPFYAAVADLLVSLASDALTETAYLAEMCELYSSIESTDTGFELRFEGYNEKLPTLAMETLECVFRFRIQCSMCPSVRARYETCLKALKRRYRNANLKVSDFARNVRIEAIRTSLSSSNEKLHALSSITVDNFLNVAQDILSNFAIEALFHGNEDKIDAKAMATTLLKFATKQGLPRKSYPPQSIFRIPKVESPTILQIPSKISDSNTACELYFQISKDNTKDRVLIDLLVDIMDEPFYDQLRTKEQFGYHVEVNARWSHGIIGCMFHVVTNVKSADTVLHRIDHFLTDFRDMLVKMSDSDYRDHVIGLGRQKLDMANSMDEETDGYWTEITDGRFEWEVGRKEAIILSQVTKMELVDAFDQWFKPGTERRMIAVQAIGTSPLVCDHRPMAAGNPDDYADSLVAHFQAKCKQQIWGKINSKLF